MKSQLTAPIFVYLFLSPSAISFFVFELANQNYYKPFNAIPKLIRSFQRYTAFLVDTIISISILLSIIRH